MNTTPKIPFVQQRKFAAVFVSTLSNMIAAAVVSDEELITNTLSPKHHHAFVAMQEGNIRLRRRVQRNIERHRREAEAVKKHGTKCTHQPFAAIL